MTADLANKKVLVVEDDSFLSSLMVEHFKKKGFDVHLAMDAEKGLETAKNELPNIILLDLILPGMDGYEFLTKAKAEVSLAGIPIVVLSNLGQKDQVDRALQLGAVDFLVKANLDLDEITAKVESILVKN